MSKIEDGHSQGDESLVSISAAFLRANKKTFQDSLLRFTQATKNNTSFSALLNLISKDIPKILTCEKSLVILIVETSNPNMFASSTKTAYFYSFTDNHTYNFNYDGTFVEKILDSGNPITFSVNTQIVLPASIKNSVYANHPKNISNEYFHTIRYLPVPVVVKGEQKIMAILETCYNESSVQGIFGRFNNDQSYISDMAEEDK